MLVRRCTPGAADGCMHAHCEHRTHACTPMRTPCIAARTHPPPQHHLRQPVSKMWASLLVDKHDGSAQALFEVREEPLAAAANGSSTAGAGGGPEVLRDDTERRLVAAVVVVDGGAVVDGTHQSGPHCHAAAVGLGRCAQGPAGGRTGPARRARALQTAAQPPASGRATAPPPASSPRPRSWRRFAGPATPRGGRLWWPALRSDPRRVRGSSSWRSAQGAGSLWRHTRRAAAALHAPRRQAQVGEEPKPAGRLPRLRRHAGGLSGRAARRPSAPQRARAPARRGTCSSCSAPRLRTAPTPSAARCAASS